MASYIAEKGVHYASIKNASENRIITVVDFRSVATTEGKKGATERHRRNAKEYAVIEGDITV